MGFNSDIDQVIVSALDSVSKHGIKIIEAEITYIYDGITQKSHFTRTEKED